MVIILGLASLTDNKCSNTRGVIHGIAGVVFYSDPVVPLQSLQALVLQKNMSDLSRSAVQASFDQVIDLSCS